MRLKELCRRYSPEQFAVFVSPRLTNEEIYLAQKLARIALRTHNVSTFACLVNREYDCPEVVSTATYADLIDAQTILVVNSNLDEEHFVVDLLGKRAIRKGGRLLYVGSQANRTSAASEIFMRCRPGTEPQVVLALLKAYATRTAADLSDRSDLARAVAAVEPGSLEKQTGVAWSEVEAAAGILAQAILKVLVFNKDFRGPRAPGDARLFALAAELLGCPLLALREKSNMQGLLDMGASPCWLPGYVPIGDEAATDALEKDWCVVLRGVKGHGADLATALMERRIKVAVVLGEDPLANGGLPEEMRAGLAAVEFLLVGDVFLTATAGAANVVLPLSTLPETSGTMTNQERRVQRVRRAIPPRNGRETWQILTQLAARMGHRFKMKYQNVGEVTDEIRRVVSVYAGVVIDDAGHDGLWDAARFPMAGVLPDFDRLRSVDTPVPTLALDSLEARFAKRFREQLEAADRHRRSTKDAAAW
jgi:predicted molibdopterin-dependent oxidoreductase YjgC